jgi:hypothetical protein
MRIPSFQKMQQKVSLKPRYPVDYYRPAKRGGAYQDPDE